jgi:hypothetical protein
LESGIGLDVGIGSGAGIDSDDGTGGNNASLRIPTENMHNAMVIALVIIHVCFVSLIFLALKFNRSILSYFLTDF